MAIVLNAIAIISVLIFWLRLNKIETKVEKYLDRHIYRRKRALKPRLIPQPIVKTRIKTQAAKSKAPSSFAPQKRSPQVQIYSKVASSKPHSKRAGRWRWLLAILVASVTGAAIAFVQWSNGVIAPEYTALIWFGIGIFLVASATYAL
ncbi:MAG: hypothetical protein DCE90_05240 [Pseudanabaena sp.]|nr:MAG: hypothetical protein DCE90_05240 [Pseudanabaena sp.]